MCTLIQSSVYVIKPTGDSPHGLVVDPSSSTLVELVRRQVPTSCDLCSTAVAIYGSPDDGTTGPRGALLYVSGCRSASGQHPATHFCSEVLSGPRLSHHPWTLLARHVPAW